MKLYHPLPAAALRQAGLSCQRAGESPTLARDMRAHTRTHTHARAYTRVLLTHCRLLERLAEERACALTLAEGRREVIEVRQRDGSFFADEGGGFNALLRYYGVCVF